MTCGGARKRNVNKDTTRILNHSGWMIGVKRSVVRFGFVVVKKKNFVGIDEPWARIQRAEGEEDVRK